VMTQLHTSAGAPEPLIEISELTKTFGQGDAEVRALRGVDLRVGSGEFVALMGPSGSGKSTFMNIVGCLDKATSGSYYFKGVDVGQLDMDALALLRRYFLGFVFQGFNLLGRTSALSNVELPLLYRGISPPERRARALQALADVGLIGRESHTPAELSGGQQQRVAFARAIVSDPAVLLADEPTGNLDTEMSVEIMDLMVALNEGRGITILMVTHEPEMARYAKRLVSFVDGEIRTDRRQKPK
jgi:putative ABC transport system ATP-binding protein